MTQFHSRYLRTSTNINNIPPEIITKILLFYLQTSWETRRSPRRARQPHILLRDIRLTCKFWRDIIASTPEFWTFVDVQVAPCGTPSLSLSNLNKWLERSRQLPLTISFEVEVFSPPPHTKLTNKHIFYPLLQRLMDHVSRWQDVALSFCLPNSPPYKFPPFLITDGSSMIAPILESLSVNLKNYGHDRIAKWITPLLASSPRFRVFADSFANSFPLSVIPLSQLREVTLENCWSPFDGLKILAKMPMLERCRLSFLNFPDKPIDIAPMICYAKSMTLSFRVIRPTFFPLLIAPNLTELSYHVEWSQDDLGFHQSLLSFLTNTHGQITSFTVDDCFIESNKLLEILRVLSPSLEKLEILMERSFQWDGIKGFSKDVVLALTYHREQRLQNALDGGNSGEDLLCCPKLQVMRLERCEDGIEDGLISNMVASRRAHGSSPGVSELFFFSILFLRQTSRPLDVERLIEMRRTGLTGTTEFLYPHND
jgi:F-box-like